MLCITINCEQIYNYVDRLLVNYLLLLLHTVGAKQYNINKLQSELCYL